jgi:hypothetical protein
MSITNEISLCIPRVFVNIDEKRVRAVFEQLLGKIYRVDIIERANEKGEKYKRVFVHFEYWYNTEEAQKAKARLEEGKELKIVYDDPWFWKVSINKVNTRPRQRINLLSKPKPSNPRIDFEADDTKVLTNQYYEKMTHGQKGTPLPLPIAPALSAMLPIAPALPVRERETRERETREREKRNQKKYEPKPKNNRPIKEEPKKPTEDGEIIDKNSK